MTEQKQDAQGYVWLAIDSVVQGAGLALGIGGIVFPDKVRVPDALGAVRLAPGPGGVQVLGTF